MEKSTRRATKEKVKPQKPSWVREFSAGGIVFKEGKPSQWLIIQPKDTERWQLPKGHIDPGESSKEASVREVFEEGGVRAEILEKVGNQRYFFQLKGKKIVKSVAFFLMRFLALEGSPDPKEIGEAKFVPFAEAVSLLTFKDDRGLLSKANELLVKKYL